MNRLFRRRVLLGGSVGAAIIAAVMLATGFPGGRSSVDSPPEFRGHIAAFVAHPEPIPAPEARFTDKHGRMLSLADFSGRLVLLNFWATWCAPCVEEMPALDRLQARLGGPGFEVVTIALDRQGRELVEPFLAKLGISRLAPYLDQSNSSMRAFALRGLPTTVVIDAQGREIGRLEGAAPWDSPQAETLIQYYLAKQRPA